MKQHMSVESILQVRVVQHCGVDMCLKEIHVDQAKVETTDSCVMALKFVMALVHVLFLKSMNIIVIFTNMTQNHLFRCAVGWLLIITLLIR
jgi:hypothetical protein